VGRQVDIKGRPEMTLTYAELQQRSTDVAVMLRTKWGLKPGDRALLLYPMGLHFVIAFWGCLQVLRPTHN
jgi:acyl-CoA synthetase (AMP-forming)/AMP-acid ligase II